MSDGSIRPRQTITQDLSFLRNRAEVLVGFRPGYGAVILFDGKGEVLDHRKVYLSRPEDSSTASAVGARTISTSIVLNPKRVFVVHGRDEGGKDAVCRLLERSGLEAIVLQERPHRGRTLIEKLEDYGDVGYAVVILSGDDVGGLQVQETGKLNPRARQNVIFELGIFLGRLGRGRVCLLYRKGVELPSDLSGLGYVEMDSGGTWKMKLAREMNESGISVDLKKIAELS